MDFALCIVCSVYTLAILLSGVPALCYKAPLDGLDPSLYLERDILYFRNHIPQDWTNNGRLNSRSPFAKDISFHVVLAQNSSGIIALKRNLDLIANPTSAQYGKWLSREAVLQLVEPAQEAVLAVASWLQLQHVHFLKFTGDAFKVKANASIVEALFQTQLHTFCSVKHQELCLVKHFGNLSIPTSLSRHIIMVTGITEFPPINRGRITPLNNDHGNNAHPVCNTPPSIRLLYNMTSNDVVTEGGATQAAYGASFYSNPDGFGEAELSFYQKDCSQPLNPIRRILGSGKYTSKYADTEANLDIQMLTSIGINATTDFFIQDAAKGWLYEYTQEFWNTSDAPLVNVICYGFIEWKQCRNSSQPFGGKCGELHIPNSKAYVERTNIEFMKLTAMGYTFVVASGDDGVAGIHMNYDCNMDHPIWPASSPYVLSVGASVPIAPPLSPVRYSEPICKGWSNTSCACNSNITEIASMQTNYGGFDSGGGFSVYSERPTWQDSAVQGYFESGVVLPPTGSFNGNGRGYPDVSAVGGNIAVVAQGFQLIGGTSASAPIVAGMISILNSQRLSVGKSPVGFINPVLYQAQQNCSECFHDIVTGKNPGQCTQIGFSSAIGWDPVTGLGTLNFGELKHFISQLP